jgi:hypothetical protein
MLMGEPKPLASLSSSLLARKGHARPAMRPQGFGGFGGLPQGVEDLGWNDMGFDGHQVTREDDHHHDLPSQPLPTVLLQREQLHEELGEPTLNVPDAEPEPELSVEAPHPEPAPVVALTPRRVADATLSKISRETGVKKGKAAFTLRLDPDRHLRLRLACAVNHCSAQVLVTEALDAFLASMPQVDELASRLPSVDKR